MSLVETLLRKEPFHLLPLSGSPSQTWMLIQGIMYLTFGFSIMGFPQILNVFNSDNDDEFNKNDCEFAQIISAFISIIGLLFIGNGSDTFYNREVIPLILPSMANLPESHSLIATFHTSFVRLIFIPTFFISILLSFGRKNNIIQIMLIILCIIDPVFAIISLCIIKKYPPSDYNRYSAIILSINESDVSDMSSSDTE